MLLRCRFVSFFFFFFLFSCVASWSVTLHTYWWLSYENSFRDYCLLVFLDFLFFFFSLFSDHKKKAILGEVPSEEVLQKLFALMDTNGDGQISLDEFLAAMGEWLGGDEFEKRKKPQVSFSEERLEVHQEIKSFFQQFSVPDNFSAVRQALKEKVFRGQMTMDQLEESDMMGMSRTRSDDSAKLAALNYANDAVLNFSQVMNGLSSNNPFQQLEATKAVVQLLQLVVVFGTPLERRSITSVLVKIFHLCYEGGVMQRIMSFLTLHQQPPLQFQALLAITLYLPGPRIASTPVNHDLHPDKMLFKRHVKNAGAIRLIYELLDHQMPEIRNQAIACLGAFAAQHPAARDFLLQNNGLVPLLRFANLTQPLDTLQKVSFVLACMVGYTHPPGFQPDFGLVRPCLPAIAAMTYHNDKVVLRNCLAAMALVLPVVPEPNMLLRVLEVLTWQDDAQADQVMSALVTVTEVIKMDNTQTRMLLEKNFIVILRNLLKSRQDHVRLAAVEALTVLCQKGFQQPLFDGKIIPTALELLASDNYVRWKVGHLLRLVSNGTPQQVSFLVNSCDIVRKLCESLGFFKQYDQVLSTVYKYMGPSYNFTFIFDIVTALHNITNVGFLVAEQTGENNAYALRFSMGDIDNIKGLLTTLASNQEEEAAWRKTSQGDHARGLEELVASLLVKIKKANDRSTSSQSQVIVREVTALWQRFFGKTQQVASADHQIYFKCILTGVQSGDDIRIVEAPKNITFANLLEMLQLKYHRRLVLRFRDAEGDLVVLDNEGALHRALESARNNTVVLSLQEVGDLMSVSSSGATSAQGSTALELSPTTTPKKRVLPDSGGAAPMNSSAPFDWQNSPPKASMSPLPKPLAQAQQQQQQGANRGDLKSSVTNWMQGIEHVQTFSRGDHIEQIRQQVGLAPEQVERLKSTFEKLADSDGFINRYKFADGLRAIGITSDLLIEQNWNAFDDDRDGRISIKEFLTAVGIMSAGSTRDKLRFVFNMYDKDGNGELDKDEVTDIFRVSATLKGTYIAPPQLKAMVDKTFDEIDLNKNGTIDFEEFAMAIQRNQLAVNTRVAFV